MRAPLVAIAVVALAGCGLLKKKTADADAGVDAGTAADAGDLDAGDTAELPPEPAPTQSPPPPPGIFPGNYRCGATIGDLKVSQQADAVTASHMESKGAFAHVAQCTANGTKCAGTFRVTDTKTMKTKTTGPVTMEKTPKGDLTYKAGAGKAAATLCKKQ